MTRAIAIRRNTVVPTRDTEDARTKHVRHRLLLTSTAVYLYPLHQETEGVLYVARRNPTTLSFQSSVNVFISPCPRTCSSYPTTRRCEGFRSAPQCCRGSFSSDREPVRLTVGRPTDCPPAICAQSSAWCSSQLENLLKTRKEESSSAAQKGKVSEKSTFELSSVSAGFCRRRCIVLKCKTDAACFRVRRCHGQQ